MGLAMFYEMLSDLQFYEIIKCADHWYMKHYMKIYDNHSGFFLWECVFFCLRLGLYFIN